MARFSPKTNTQVGHMIGHRTARRVGLAALLSSMALALAACGGGGGNNNETKATAQQLPDGLGSLAAQTQTIALGSLPLAPGEWRRARAVVPITVYRYGTGDMFMTVPITIGNTTLDAILDTGSAGLRVLPGALQDSDYTLTATPSQVSYNGGERLTGFTASANVRIGNVAIPTPVMYTQAKTVDCTEQTPNCPANTTDKQNYALLKDASHAGVKAILGVGLRGDTVDPRRTPFDNVYSPLAQVGNGAYIIKLNPANTGGELIVQPDDTDSLNWMRFNLQAQGFSLPNGLPAQWDSSLEGCIASTPPATRHCGWLLLDSGNPRNGVYAPDIASPYYPPPGTSIQFSLKQDATHAFRPPAFNVTPSDLVGGHATVVGLDHKDTPDTFLVWGAWVFQHYDVVFSQSGFIALRPH